MRRFRIHDDEAVRLAFFSWGTPSPFLWGGLFVLLRLQTFVAVKRRFERF
jgi:hypothetical protein